MKYNTIKLAVCCLAFGSLAVSCDFLDSSEATYYDKDEILYSPSRVSQLCTQVYSYLPYGLGSEMHDAGSDDAIHVYPTASICKFTNGTWSANNTINDVFGTYYKAIHDANFYLENCLGLTFDDWKNSDGFADTYSNYLNYQYEVRCLRAFYYFELVKRYKNIPLVTHTLTEQEADTISPVSASKVLDFVVAELDTVAKYLPNKATDLRGAASNMQRMSKGAALALKSRVTLYQASPLFAGSDDQGKWKAAAAAAYDVIRQASAFGFALDGNYSNLFGSTNNQSPEMIICRPGGKTTSFESANFPIGVKNGYGSTCPTENLVDAYEMKDGSAFDWSDPQQSANPYKNRDPRLAMTVVYNGMTWPAKSAVETFEGGKNGLPLQNATTTGYYLRKYVNNNTTFEAGQTTTSYDHNWVIMRYAEILMNYAEAAAHAYGPDVVPEGYTLSARDAVNKVRARKGVNMPPYPQGKTTEAFLARLENERRVEFAFEDQRFWDLRRWKQLNEMRQVYKVMIHKQADGSYQYTKGLLETYDISDKMYFYPFSNAELFKNRSLVQNEGWK